MRKKYLLIGLAMGSLSFGQTKVDSTCVGITTKNTNCNIKVNVDSTKYCHWHDPAKINVNRCNGISKSTKNQCKLKTKDESGFCHYHRPKNK
tara:strand:+ start:525 stop:800 length:276 start_codon:yes stop_codon:yes gene_type:complete